MSWLSRILGLGVRPENSIYNKRNQNYLQNEDISVMSSFYQAQLDESAKKISNLEDEVARLRETLERNNKPADDSNSDENTRVKIGDVEYELDGTKKAEDALSDDVLSKEAKTLSKDEQLAVLKEAGIDVDKLTMNDSDKNNVSFTQGNVHYRVVDDKGTKKIIQSTIKGKKVSTEVSKLEDKRAKNRLPRETNLSSQNTRSSIADIVSMQADVDQLQSYIEELDEQIKDLRSEKGNKGAIKVLQDEKKVAEKELESIQTKLMRAKLNAGILGSGSRSRKSSKKEKSGLEKFNENVKSVKKTADTISDTVDTLRDLSDTLRGKRRNRWRW